jgi:hypothetical protein
MAATDKKNGTTAVDAYSIVDETAKVFRESILENPLVKQHLVEGLEKYAAFISFAGSPKPVLPVNWRFAESVSSLKALEGTYVNAILDKVYGVSPQKAVINTLVLVQILP